MITLLMVDYKQFNKYHTLLQDYSEDQVIETINEYLKVIPELDYKKVIFTNDYVITGAKHHAKDSVLRTYIDTFQLLEYNELNNFIDYIIKEYIINKKQLLEVIYNYDIINERLNDYCSKNAISKDMLKYIINCNFELVKLRLDKDITDNDIIDVSNKTKLPNLTHLDLYCNTNISNNIISKLTNLTILDLGRNNNISYSSIKKLTKLTSLHLNRNKNFSDTNISKLTNLTSLDLGWNTELTNDCISKLINLTSLNLGSNNNITDDGISKLINLRILILRSNYKISENGINKLTNLNTLVGHNFRITNYEINKSIKLIDINQFYE